MKHKNIILSIVFVMLVGIAIYSTLDYSNTAEETLPEWSVCIEMFCLGVTGCEQDVEDGTIMCINPSNE